MTTPFFLPTELLYQKPDFTKHNDAMKIYLQAQFGDEYFDGQMTVEAKWDLLMQRFRQQVPVAYQSLFASFQERRKQVNDGNRFNLMLPDTLAFFENFYFLYAGDKAEFCISQSNQAAFLKDLERPMGTGVCEPGIVTEFNTHLRKYRSDTNWILVELHEQRSNFVQRIADEYNAINNVEEGYSIHTTMHMMSIAKEKSLGVEPEREIEDIYIYFAQTQAMTAYFESVYEDYCAQYEANIIANLAEHALFSLRSDPLAELDLSDWDNNPLVLTEDQTNSIYPKLGEFFSNHFTEDDRQSITEYVDALSILKKSDVLARLKELVEKKLKQEHFLVNFNTLTQENIQNYNLRLPTDINIHTLCTLAEKLQTAKDDPQQLLKILTETVKLVEKYPSLITNSILANPSLWRYLPRTLRVNSAFFDSIIEQIDSSVNEMVQSDRVDDSDSLIELLVMMIQPNMHVLMGYPSALFLNNKEFALRLVAKNGAFYKYLSSELQEDEQVIDYTLKQNPAMTKYFPENRQLHLDNAIARLVERDMTSFIGNEDCSLVERIDNAESALSLLETEVVPLLTLTQLAQSLSPSELLYIVKARQQRGMRPLPELTEEGLSDFIAALELTEQGWEPNYLTFKRRISKNNQFIEPSFSLNKTYEHALAQQCLSRSNHWLAAFVAFQKQIPLYHEPFSTMGDVLDQLKLTGRIAWLFLKSLSEWLTVLVKLAAYYALTLLVSLVGSSLAPYIAYVVNTIAAYTGGLLLLCVFQLYIAAQIINHLSNNNYNTFVNLALLFIALAAPTAFIMEVFTIEAAYLGCYLLATIIAGANSIIGRTWSFAEIHTLASTALEYLVSATANLYLATIQAVILGGTKLITVWPKQLFALIVPWITRSIASYSNGQSLDGDDSLRVKVENNILRLLNSESVSANLKGTILNSLWQTIQLDVALSKDGLTLTQALNRKYTVSTDGKSYDRSFMDVASTHRATNSEFSLDASQSHYSFFGSKGKTRTSCDLHQYVDQEVALDEHSNELVPNI